MRAQFPLIVIVCKTFWEMIISFREMMSDASFVSSNRAIDLLTEEWEMLTREARAVCRKNDSQEHTAP